MERAIVVLWPSFLVACVAEAVFFTVIDPQELYLFGQPVYFSRLATYSIGFFAFWAVCAASSLVTVFFQRTADQINRCPLPAAGRPDGCPRREEPGACL